MQDLLNDLFGCSAKIDEAAGQLCKSLPGFSEAQHAYTALAEQIQTLAGPDLYDQYFSQLMRYTNYEVRAYYSLGLGLREDITKALGV